MNSAFATYRDCIAALRTSTITSGCNWDGREEWQPVKNSLSDKSGEQRWSALINEPSRVEFYNRAMNLAEVDESGETIELSHFIMQCARIPILDVPSPRKIMQIALNIGQLESEVEIVGIEALNPEFSELYAEFIKLGMRELEAYI